MSRLQNPDPRLGVRRGERPLYCLANHALRAAPILQGKQYSTPSAPVKTTIVEEDPFLVRPGDWKLSNEGMVDKGMIKDIPR